MKGKKINQLAESEIALRERVKELTCLYKISELSQKGKLSIPHLLSKIVALFPAAWQYSDMTVARIILDNKPYCTQGFKITRFQQCEKIILHGKERGSVEIYYLRAMPASDEGPFLKEERKLIREIAQKIAIIIERKEAEANMRLLQEQIRHADRLASIGELTAGIAHELNNPLHNILGFAQLLIQNDSLNEQAKLDVEKIIKAALNSREIIKKLMYFSRQMPQDFKNVNLNQVIRDTMCFIEPQCKNENISISFHLENDIPEIYADTLQLNQVIVDLVVNAIQAMPEGGTLTISTRTDNQSVLLKVEDNGTGISRKIIQHIFNPFFTTKAIGKGTGLGLSVVHGIVSAHKGTIHVHSKEGVGTKFEIRFPILID
jgi:signal transduction histidine kinase